MAPTGAPIPLLAPRNRPEPLLGAVEEKHLCALSGGVYIDVVMAVTILDFSRLRAAQFCGFKLGPQTERPSAAQSPVSSHP
ncbi:hypothetical protein NDU88_001492 [Pleurodeles waltl]|uniref:Uncharacterized protein n=1 Tax=Pleurodeles waltl TaxID=8319 RepID=A0AAV7WIH3_PLEWA|nr:hypothetical protein NDU88_001492 [Pleurodeles waltl]